MEGKTWVGFATVCLVTMTHFVTPPISPGVILLQQRKVAQNPSKTGIEADWGPSDKPLEEPLRNQPVLGGRCSPIILH